MLTLEMAIQKIQQLRPEQRSQVIQFVEFLDITSNQAAIVPDSPSPDTETSFFELAGIWENKEITAASLRAEAWGETK
jgi:hypothetical protein